MKAGRGPIYMHTQEVLDTKEKEEIGCEDLLDMTISQTVVWASQNIDPKEKASEDMEHCGAEDLHQLQAPGSYTTAS